MGSLVIRNLYASYDGPTVVDGLDLEVPEGHVMALIGPNGAGKTTCLRTIAGRHVADAGVVIVDGVDRRVDEPEFRRRLVFVPDTPVLFDDLTLAEHLAFTAAVFDMNREFAERRADDLLERFGLSHRADDLPTTFSRGMRQRSQLCCAFLRPFEVMLIDEPFVGLDPAGVRTLLDLIEERRVDGAAFVVATHSLSLVGDAVDDYGLFLDGEIHRHDELDTLFAEFDVDSAEDLFVAIAGQHAAHLHDDSSDDSSDDEDDDEDDT
jgi:ABC-2 type transport system ATP-binding protein